MRERFAKKWIGIRHVTDILGCLAEMRQRSCQRAAREEGSLILHHGPPEKAACLRFCASGISKRRVYSDGEWHGLLYRQELAAKALRKDHDLRHEVASIPLEWSGIRRR